MLTALLAVSLLHVTSLSVRMWRTHSMHMTGTDSKTGLKSDLRHKVSSSHCECCLGQYYTRNRLLTHVMHSSPKCNRYYTDHVDPVTAQEFEKLEKDTYDDTIALRNKGHRRTYAGNRTPVRLQGPLRAEAEDCGVDHATGLKCPKGTRAGIRVGGRQKSSASSR